jgi:fatty-acyl-CoA synthase
VPSIELTGTFRLKKSELALQGYDPARVSDPVYFDDRSLEAYVKVDAALYERIRAGSLRL